MIAKLLGLALTLGLGLAEVGALENGLARTPPMGWISWARFICNTDCHKYPADCISSRLYADMADAIDRLGLRDAGYQYINIDDCWSTHKRHPETQELVADPERFPLGMKHLAGYVHKKGLKFGIYGDCGTLTCAKYPAQLKNNDTGENWFDLDAKTFNDWEVDSFKFDGCYVDPIKAESICPKMSEVLQQLQRKGGRSILLTCEWPFYLMRHEPNYPINWGLVRDKCNLWRYYEDIEDSWQSIMAVLSFTLKIQDQIVEYHGPGAWFDPDQLEIGNFALTHEQARTQMALWCLWSAPLFMSNDLRNIDAASVKLLTHKKLIEVNQDPWGVFGFYVDEANFWQSNFWAQAFVKPVAPVVSGCPSFVVLYFYNATLGSATEVSFPVREMLAGARKAIEVAASRSGGQIADARACLDRYIKREPVFRLEDLMDPDLHDGRARDIKVTDNLELLVNPNGVRVVKLVEKA